MRDDSAAAPPPATAASTAGLFAAALLATTAGCDDENAFVPPPPPAVTVAEPLRRPVVDYFQTTGTTRSAARAELRARVTGYLREVHFEDGAAVAAGEKLFTIDPRPYEAALAQARGRLEAARAAVKQAEAQVPRAKAAEVRAEAALILADRQYKRAVSLQERGANTQEDVDEAAALRKEDAADVAVARAEIAAAQAALDAAKAEVATAEASVSDADLNLGYTTVTAPFAGRVGRRLVDPGNLVRSGETLLTTLEAVEPIHVYFDLTESDLLRFLDMQRSGELTISEADPPTIEIALGEGRDFAFAGRLDFREFGVDPGTGTTTRRAVFANDDGRLIPGLFVRVRAAVGEPAPRLLVEERAVGVDQRGDYLLTVDDEDTVQYRPVTLGRSDAGLVVIEAGLSGGERVVVNGLQRARPGAKVAPEAAEMTPNPDANRGAFALDAAPADPPPVRARVPSAVADSAEGETPGDDDAATPEPVVAADGDTVDDETADAEPADGAAGGGG